MQTLVRTLELGLFWFVSWVSIYQLTRNFRGKFSWLLFITMMSLAGLYVFDILSEQVTSLPDYRILHHFWLALIFFVVAFGFHLSVLVQPEKQAKQLKPFVAISYISGALLTITGIATDLIFNYSSPLPLAYAGNLIFPGERGFWVGALFGFIFEIAVPYNFLRLYRAAPADSQVRTQSLYALLGTAIYTIASLLIIIHHYYPIELVSYKFNGLATIGTAFVVYSIMRYNLFIDDYRLIFNREFWYTTCATAIILAVYIVLLGSFSEFSIISLVGILLVPLVLLSHSTYDWVVTLIRDVVYNRVTSGLSLVTDEEVSFAIRHYRNPSKLEESSLLRLNLIQIQQQAHSFRKTPVDSLRNIIREAIEYLKPGDSSDRRTRQAIKYRLLSMIAFDEAEEGQILWELGFEDYPLKIMGKESISRKPILQVQAPSDYSATSRNAFMLIKKEAIHDLTWRISYLERLSRRQKI